MSKKNTKDKLASEKFRIQTNNQMRKQITSTTIRKKLSFCISQIEPV